MRLIDADALMETLGITDTDRVKCAWYSRALRGCQKGGCFEDACCAIEDAPTVDPVKHGHWIIQDNPGTGWYRVTCSECGEDITSVAPVIGFFPNAKVIWNFCPECGADMRGDTE